MPSHTTTIRYIGQPEGYRTDIPIDIINNCKLTTDSAVGVHFESDVQGIGLSFRDKTADTNSTRSLNYDGASRKNAIITLPKQFIKMFGLSGAPVTFFPGRGGLVAQIAYTPRFTINPLPETAPTSTISVYSSGHYGVRVPVDIVNPDEHHVPNLLEHVGDDVWLSLDTTSDNSLAIIVDTTKQRAPETSQCVSANPSMLYRRDGEIGFLFPIPVGDLLLREEPVVRWSRDSSRLIGVIDS